MPNTRSRASWLKIGAAALIALAGLSYLSRNRVLGQPVAAYAVTRAELKQSVVASGRVLTPQRIAVAAELTGRVRQIPVREGQMVVAGELLIELDDADEQAGVALATAAVAQAQARTRQLREVDLPVATQALKLAQANAAQALSQLARVRDLKTRGFIGQAQLDEAVRNQQVAVSQVDSARLQLKGSDASGSAAALALAALDQAQANLALARVKLAQDSILAPAGGILIARAVEPGDMVQPGQTLMQLAADGEIQIALQIDEKNLAKLALGQSALGSADAYPAQRFDAQLVYINPAVDASRGAVEVKLRVLDAPAYLRQDMTVSVDILTAHRPSTLVLPTGALRDATSAAPWVLVVRQHHLVRQPVKLGLLGDDRVEVLDGLTVGEPVILASAVTLSAGQRVRARLQTLP